MARHGNVTWAQIEVALAPIATAESYMGIGRLPIVGIRKARRLVPSQIISYVPPAPHDLRNGRLNQTGYSLFLFIRDVAGGDLVVWIDQQVAPHLPAATSRPRGHRWSTRSDRVYGISDKVIAMALATLLMGAGAGRPGWFDVGASSLSSIPSFTTFWCEREFWRG